jgi:hypothetical protein
MAPADGEATYQPKDRRATPEPHPTAGITIPIGWFTAIVLGMLGTVGSGAWYMADQAAEIRSLRSNIVKVETESSTSRKNLDDALNGLRVALNAQGDRTTRIESQLIYITDQLRSSKK